MKKPSIKTVMKWTGGVMAALVLCVALAYQSLPEGYARGKLAGSIGDRIGRDFSFEGPLDISWHWTTPRIRAHGVRIANIPGSDVEDMVNIDEVDLRIKMWKLLAGNVDIPAIHIVRPRIYLEKTDAEHKNWEFPALSGANAAVGAALPDDRGDMPLIGVLRIEGGQLVYKDVPRGLDVTLDMETVRGKSDSGAEVFNFSGTGSLEGQKFDVKAEGGSLELLRDTSKEFPLTMTLTVGKSKLFVDGTFTDPVKLTGLDTELRLEGANLADLFYLMHIPFPPTPTYDLKGHLAKEGDIWTFNSFAGRVGGSDLSGDLVYDASGERPLLKGKMASKRLDVADLGGLIGLEQGGGKTKTAARDKILPDTPLDLKRLRAGDMDITLSAQKLNAPGWPLSDMKTHIKLVDGQLDLAPLHFGVAEGTADGFLSLNGQKDVPHIKTDLTLRKLSLKRFFSGSAFAEFSKGTFNGRVQLAGGGQSFAKFLGNSDGRVVVTLSAGKISLLLIEATDIDIAELMPLFFGKDKTTDIRCGIGDFTVDNGHLKSKVFVLDTEDTNVRGKAAIDLKDETIDASIDAHPKDPSILSLQSKILVVGKLGDPTVTLDPATTGVRGAGAVLLGALNPLAAIIPFIGLGTGEDSDCQQLFEDAKAPQKSSSR